MTTHRDARRCGCERGAGGDAAERGGAGVSAPTKGPWSISRDERPDMEWNLEIVGANPDERVCFMAHDGTPENAAGEANAAVIIAAPKLLAALKAAAGYLMNARIDLETGAPKRTAITTINGGLKLVEDAIREAETAAPDLFVREGE